MELTHDWKSFQKVFFGNENHSNAYLDHSIFLILSGKIVVSAISKNEDLSEWMGATEDELLAAFPDRDFVSFEKDKVDSWLNETRDYSHYYEQTRLLRMKAKPQFLKLKKSKIGENWLNGHFLLQAVQTWWRRFFPSTYGVYVQLDGPDATSLFMVIQRGQVHSFQVPDLSSLSPERKKQSAGIIKYLSERYLMPVQGLFLTSAEWAEWSESKDPWPKVAAALRTNRNKLVPFKLSLVTLIASRAYLKF